MVKRKSVLLAAQDLGASGTKIIDIFDKEDISAIYIRMQFTVATVSVMLANIARVISKIEIADGGNVLYSVSGEQAQAIAYYLTKQMPFSKFGLTVGNACTAIIPIYFGRFDGDRELAFRPTLYANPQLKITYDEDAANTSAVVNSFSVYASLLTDSYSGQAKGMLVSKEIVSNVMTASAHAYVDLPTDLPFAKLIIQAYSTDHSPETLIDNIKLEVNNGQQVMIDQSFPDFVRETYSKYPTIVQSHVMDAAVTAKTIYADISSEQQINVEMDDTAVTAAGELPASTWTGQLLSLSASVAIKAKKATITGRNPSSCVSLDMGELDDPTSFATFNRQDSVRLDLTQSSDADSGDTLRVCALQLLNY